MSYFRSTVQDLRRDFSFSALVSSFIVVIVGVTSSAALIFESAKAVGATPEIASSWLGSLCVGMGLISIIFSIRYRVPILFAWSTPGAALLVVSLAGGSYSEAIGAFLFSAFLIFICGVTGFFEKIMNRIPLGMTAALLAGVLLQFCLNTFSALKFQPILVGSMLVSYFLFRRFLPRYAMLAVLCVGILMAIILDLLPLSETSLALTKPHFVRPTFSFSALLGIGLPLFIVTMASQNLTGIIVMRSNGYTQTPISPLLTWSGITNMIIAPFGGFALNLAAITAAIGMSPEAHPNKEKRYLTGILSGLIYIVLGLFAGTVAYMFESFPKEMITALVGIAMFPTLISCLVSSLNEQDSRESSFMTFLVTASGLSFFGVGSAFWGLVAGLIVQLSLHFKPKL